MVPESIRCQASCERRSQNRGDIYTPGTCERPNDKEQWHTRNRGTSLLSQNPGKENQSPMCQHILGNVSHHFWS